MRALMTSSTLAFASGAGLGLMFHSDSFLPGLIAFIGAYGSVVVIAIMHEALKGEDPTCKTPTQPATRIPL
jgi:hypothetical protein